VELSFTAIISSSIWPFFKGPRKIM